MFCFVVIFFLSLSKGFSRFKICQIKKILENWFHEKHQYILMLHTEQNCTVCSKLQYWVDCFINFPIPHGLQLLSAQLLCTTATILWSYLTICLDICDNKHCLMQWRPGRGVGGHGSPPDFLGSNEMYKNLQLYSVYLALISFF